MKKDEEEEEFEIYQFEGEMPINIQTIEKERNTH